MNKIYWDEDSIVIVTDHIDTVPYSHPMMQLFLSIEDSLTIEVSDKLLSGRCIVLDKNIRHAFSSSI